jgi:cell division protein FtsQ
MTKDNLEKSILKRRLQIRICMFLIFCGILITLGLKSDAFNIKNIVVQKNSIVSKEEVITLSQLQKKNLFLINKKVTNDLILSSPYIKSVNIKRKIPSTVIIEVQEKEIRGLIKLHNSFINIDEGGKMIQVVDKFPNGSIPLIEGVKVKQYIPNEPISSGNEVLDKALRAVLIVPDYKECKNLFYSIDLSDPYDIIFKTKSGISIKVGDWTNLDYKMAYGLVVLNNPIVKSSKGYIEIEPDGTAVFKKY